jgi:hypothetical protein
MVEEFDPSTIEDEQVRQVVVELMNLVETLSATVGEQAEEIQRLRDEMKRRQPANRASRRSAPPNQARTTLQKKSVENRTPTTKRANKPASRLIGKR